MPEQTPLAEVAYQAYGSATGNKNFRGDPMPAWADLPEPIKHAWTVAADAILTSAQTDQPTPILYHEIQISRHLGRGIVVDDAPEYAKAHHSIIASMHIDLRLDTGGIRIAEQVEYEITGYDPADAMLTLHRVKDWRPGHDDDPAKQITEGQTHG